MEQRIDSNNKPEFAAGTDPAYIPGLTAPAPRGAKEEPEKKTKRSKPPAGDAGRAEEEQEAAESEAAAGSDDAAEVPETPGTPETREATEADVDGGPVFEVSDRRGSIRVAREGLRFVLDGQEAEFDWDEIGAVVTDTARFGRRFTVTVHLTTRRWFNADVEAPARSDLKEWTAQLDAALDAFFEES